MLEKVETPKWSTARDSKLMRWVFLGMAMGVAFPIWMYGIPFWMGASYLLLHWVCRVPDMSMFMLLLVPVSVIMVYIPVLLLFYIVAKKRHYL